MKKLAGRKPRVKKLGTELPKVDVGRGNAFAGLGTANPEIALQKAKLVQRVRAAITAKKLARGRAA